MVISPDPMVEGEYTQDQVMVDQERQGLRYDPNKLGTLYNVHPDPEMKVFLREHMEFDIIADEVMMAWEMIA